MAKLLLGIVVATAFSLVVASSPLSNTVTHFEPLQLSSLVVSEEDGHKNLFVTFDALGEHFDLRLNHAPVFPDNYEFENDDGSVTMVRAPPNNGFTSDDLRSVLTVFDYEQRIVTGQVFHNGHLYLIERLAAVRVGHHGVREEALAAAEASGAAMAVYLDDDVVQDPDHPQHCGVGAHSHDYEANVEAHLLELLGDHVDGAAREQLRRGRRDSVSSMPPPSPCPATTKKFKIAVTGDKGFYDKVGAAGTTFEKHMNDVFSNINALYQRTVRIKFEVTSLPTPPRGQYGWDKGCTTIEDKLNKFGEWRGTHQDARNRQDGLFHLFSSCYTSGTVGLAWNGVICMTNAREQRPGEWVSGTGVSSGSDLGWRTAAHEVGHNFGAPHSQSESPRGIMFWQSTRDEPDNFLRSTQNHMCTEISQNLGNTKCLAQDSGCVAQCDGNRKECGSDGCGSVCGVCQGAGVCSSSGRCQCTRQCSNRQCGDDGCGNQCGTCGSGDSCVAGACVDVNQSPDGAYIAIHNAHRRKYDLGDVSWSGSLAAKAAEWTSKCSSSISYDGATGFNIGIWRFSGSQPDNSYIIETALNNWAAAESEWTCASDSCASGSCRDYTQMIMKDVTQIGCAHRRCPSGQDFIACFYNKFGKYVSSRPFPKEQCSGTATCKPRTTCATSGKECGSINNGCETKSCGSCPTGSRCSSVGKCECVATRSCAASGADCGSIDDGCGNTLNCGNVRAGECCVGGRRQAVTNTCSSRNWQCGSLTDSCGQKRLCGSCSSGSTCVSGRCQSNQPACEPPTCGSRNCGTIRSACGASTNCGTCGSGLACNAAAGRCECKPSVTCGTRKCGRVWNGCAYEVCGSCREGQDCQAGVCTACFNCDAMATCVSGACRCRDGYQGDGRSCAPIPDPDTTGTTSDPGGKGVTERGPGGFAGFAGDTSNWYLTSKTLTHTTDTGSLDIVRWTDATPLYSSTKTTFSVEVARSSGTKRAGLAFKMKDANNYFRVVWLADTQHLWLQAVYAGREYPSLWDMGQLAWAEMERHTFTLTLSGEHEVKLEVGNKEFTFSYNVLGDQSGVGYVGEGTAIFRNSAIATATRVSMVLAQCLTEAEFRAKIAGLLDIPVSQVSDITADSTCVARRDAGVAAGATGVTYSFTLSGSGAASSATLASTLAAMSANGGGAMVGAGLTTAGTAAAVTPAVTAGAIAITGVGASAGASAGAIAGAILGTIGAVCAVGGGAYYYKKKKAEPQHERVYSTTSLNDMGDSGPLGEPAGRRPPRGAVNVFDPETSAGRPVSISARNAYGVQ